MQSLCSITTPQSFKHSVSLKKRRVLVICQCPREDYPLVILKIYFINRFPKQNLAKQLQWNLVCSINVTVIHSDLNN